MSDIFDERRRGLEEEYFTRKNREALEKLREKRAAGEGGPARAEGVRQCPLGHGPLVEIAFEDVFIDRCQECQGVWLDAGELEHLTGLEGGESWFSRLLGGR